MTEIIYTQLKGEQKWEGGVELGRRELDFEPYIHE